MEMLIWIFQGVLCIVFIVTGLMKVFLPKKRMLEISGPAVGDLTSTQLRLAGISEVAGAIGIILPVYLDLYPILTPLAGIGLALSMLVALSLNLEHKQTKRVVLNILYLAMAIGVAVYYF
jgi:uncharacterized protein YjeT (DUF2065 family)